MPTKVSPAWARVVQSGSALWVEISMPFAAPGTAVTVVAAFVIAAPRSIGEAPAAAAALAMADEGVVVHDVGSEAAVAGPLPESVSPAVMPSPAMMITVRITGW